MYKLRELDLHTGAISVPHHIHTWKIQGDIENRSNNLHLPIFKTIVGTLERKIWTANFDFKGFLVQQVLVYWDKCVKKFQKIPIFDHLLTSNIYWDFPGKITVFEFFRENPDIRG